MISPHSQSLGMHDGQTSTIMVATGNYVSVMRRRLSYLSALGLIIVEATGMEFLLGELLVPS